MLAMQLQIGFGDVVGVGHVVVESCSGQPVRALSGRMGSGLKQRQREEKALATVASLVGALVLARALSDPKLSDDIPRATKNRLGG